MPKIDFNGETTSMAQAARGMTEAMQSGDEKKIDAAWLEVCKTVCAKAKSELDADFEAYQSTRDHNILLNRGIRPLTSKEEKFYNSLISAMKSGNPKQAFIDILTDSEDAMPETIIEDVLRDIAHSHPLLSLVDVQSTGYLTTWILNTHTYQTAAWGAITAEIEQEITSGIKILNLHQNKLSCFAILELGMLDLGPAWLDSYVRAVLTEAMSYALEIAVVSGNGSNCPIGMDRDLESETSGAYSAKTATAVTDLLPSTYGNLVATLAKDENGKDRSVDGLTLIVNPTTYLKRIMPAVTYVNKLGQYVNTSFPIATNVVQSIALEDDAAILGLPKNYFLGIGKSARSANIEYSDQYKFIEDQRVFKVVRYADGTPIDNTSFTLLDVSGLQDANTVLG